MTSAEFFDFGLSGISLSPGPRVALGLITTAFFARLRPIFERLFSSLHLSEQIEIKQIFLTGGFDAGCICVCTSTSPYTFYYLLLLLFYYFSFLKKIIFFSSLSSCPIIIIIVIVLTDYYYHYTR